ncbi:MAG TPA: DNA polymerase IV [Clostridiales bacterium]|nr:DNA polymerase IV [Clostridiales bacterium]
MYIKDRIILHSDCNNFFASVECAENPLLWEVPLAVAGDRERRRGIILAKNNIAKGFGIKTAEPIWQALKKCPDLVIVPPRHRLYMEYSKRINEMYADFTDLVEKFSIDESWLDVTGSTKLFGSGKEIADTIRKRVKKELGITVSVGVSFNKIFAKLGSDYKKPDATTVILRDNYKEILYPLPVSDMIFIGKSAREKLYNSNIRTIGDLANAKDTFIEKLLGKTGLVILGYARGEDNSPVMPIGYEREIKSIGKGLTFSRNLLGIEDVKKGLSVLCEYIAFKMREKELKCTVVTVHIKDTELKTISRQKHLDKPTYLEKEIFGAAEELIVSNWNMNKPIRMITVTGSGMISAEMGEQISLFDDEKEKKEEKLELAIDKIRKAYGKGSIKKANIINNDLGIDG